MQVGSSFFTPAGMLAGPCRAGCRFARRACRHASRPRPGWVPPPSALLAACQPAQAGLYAGLLGPPAGVTAGPGRAVCRAPRGTSRHGSRPMPAWVPAPPSAPLRRASGQRFCQLVPACMPAWPAWHPACAGSHAGCAALRVFLSQRLVFPADLFKGFLPLFPKTNLEQVFPLSLLLSSRHLKSCSISQSLL